MLARYKQAVERAIPHVPVKNGVVEIDSLWVETSIPYTLLLEILARNDLILRSELTGGVPLSPTASRLTT